MRRQPLFMYYRAREQERQHEIKPAFDLEFNDDNYAIATPAFWRAWRNDKSMTRGRTISHQYAPAKYLADQLGLPGKKTVWVVFASKSAKERFEAKCSSTGSAETTEASNADSEIKGLGWQSIRATGGMFLDERNKTLRSQRSPVVAWLNYNQSHYSVNVVHSAFKLTRPIPASITDLGDAVDWVYKNSVWRPSEGRTS